MIVKAAVLRGEMLNYRASQSLGAIQKPRVATVFVRIKQGA